MSYPVTYYCPRCGAVVALERDGYLADKAVTPYPFEGWTYAAPDDPFEGGAADGVRFVCGESEAPGLEWTGERRDPGGADGSGGGRTTDPTAADRAGGRGVGCGEPFYLSFVRYEGGEEVDPRRPSDRVEIGAGGARGGPSGPGGPTPGPGSGSGTDSDSGGR